MDFFLANSLLEGVQDDLTEGLFAAALEKLQHIAESYNPGDVISFKSIGPAKVVTSKPKKDPEPEPGQGKPMKLAFKALVKKQQESGSDTPESLGAFLHRNFGHKKWDHAKAMKVAAKAHGKPKDFARATADHYIRLSREAENKQEGIFDKFIGGGKGAKKPNVSDEPRRGPGPIPNRHAAKNTRKPFKPAVVGYP